MNKIFKKVISLALIGTLCIGASTTTFASELSPEAKEAGLKRIRTILRALDPKAAATMSRRERTEAFRIRRSVVAWILALCVIVSCTSCSVHAVLVNAVLNGHAKTAQIGNSGTHSEKTDQSAKSEKKSQQSEKKT